MARHSLNFDIHAPEYGWMLRAKDHTGAAGIHSEGWSKDWKNWVFDHERKGTKITQAMIDRKLARMMRKYKLAERGFPTRHCYQEAKAAYGMAERMARRQAAEAAGRLARGGSRRGLRGKLRGSALGVGIGFGITLIGSWAMGSENPMGDALESLDPFDPVTLGSADLWTPESADLAAYNSYALYQQQLADMQARRDRGGFDSVGEQGHHFGGGRVPTPVSHPR